LYDVPCQIVSFYISAIAGSFSGGGGFGGATNCQHNLSYKR